jgi:hypothetical protein
MAAKYWYVAGNGSGLWSTAANWYNGPGGTLGTTTVPTIADDVYLTAESGSGTLTISLAGSFQTLDCTGFTGTLAGTANLACTNAITLGSSMGLTWTGTATTTGTTTFTSNGKIITFNITVSSINGVLIPNDNFTMSPTATLTLSGGVIQPQLLSYSMSVGLFVSTGSVERAIIVSEMTVTGSGTVWSVTGTNFSWNDGTFVNVTNTSASTKTITNTVTTASASYGGTFRVSFLISGAGTGSYTANGNFYDFYCYNTGGASINFGTTTMYQNFDWGIYAPPGVTPNMNWNNGASTMTFNSDYGAIYFNSAMTITTSAAITINNPTAAQAFYLSNQYNKSFTSTITVIGSDSTGIIVIAGSLITTASIILTNGTIDTTGSGGDIYCGALSSSNTNPRAILTNDLYLSGSGTLISSATNANLTVSINNVYLISSLSVARTLSFNTVFYPQIGVYLGGSGGSTITLAASTTGVFDVYVTNTGGASISFSAATIKSLEFLSGTNAIWSNAVAQTLTIGSNLTIAASAGTPTLTPTMIFNGFAVLGSGSTQALVTLNGKSLRSGTVTINDTVTGANQLEVIFDGFSSNNAFTITSAAYVYFNGPFIGTAFTSTACNTTYFLSSLTLSGIMLLNNNVLGYGNTIYVTGISSIATLTHSAQGAAIFVGNANVTSSITLSNATSPSTLSYFGTLTTPTLTISNGNLESYGTLNVSGTLTLTLGNIQTIGARNYNIGVFAAAGTGVRYISLGNGTWTITGNTGIIWNLNTTNLIFDGGTATINITDPSSNALTFSGSNAAYYSLQWNRAGSTGTCAISGAFSCVNFIDIGTAAHTLAFQQGNTQQIGNFSVNGSPGNLITLNSQNGINGFTLNKSPLGVVNCDYLNIQHCIATPSTNTWYAGPNSVNNQAVSSPGSGWIFANMPPRKLGAGGVG